MNKEQGATTMKGLSDPLYRNSFFLIMTSGLTAVSGFIFWVLAARLYPAEDVGIAAAAISLAQLVSTFSILGFDMGSIKFVHEIGGEVITSSIGVVFAVSFVISTIVAFQINLISQKTAELLKFPLNVYFILTTVAISVAAVLRQGAFVAVRDTSKSFIQSLASLPRLAVLPFLVFAGAIGIFISFSITPLLALIIGLYMVKKLKLLNLKFRMDIVKKMFSYSFSNYVSVVLEAMPGFILPVMVINILGAKENAYFYIAWAIASLMIAIPRSTSMSLFAECSYSELNVKRKVYKAMKFITLFVLPGIAAIYFAGNYLLMFFGKGYSENSFELLRVLVFAALPYSINTVYSAVCRAKKRMGQVIAIFFTVSFTTLALSYIFMRETGIIGVGYAWLAGNFLAVLLVICMAIKSFGFHVVSGGDVVV